MKKLCAIAILSLTALGLCADLASARFFHHCCDKYTVCCKPYNAFSPPCCTPCGHGWQCNMAPFSPCAYPAPMAHCQGCAPGYGGGAPADARPMPPATAAPGYMPPAPAEVGEPQTMMPGYGMPMMPGYGMPGYGMPGYGMPQGMPVAFQPGQMGYGYPAAIPPAMPGYGMPQGMMPGYLAPQGMMMPGPMPRMQ